MASRMDYLRGEEQKRLAAGGTRASALEQRADEAREGFDAADYARQVASTTFSDFRRNVLDRGVTDLRGNQVSRGRIDTGYGLEDEDRYIGDATRDLDAELARQAFTAASLDLENTAGIQRGAEVARDQDLTTLAGATDRAQAEENARAQKKRRRFGLLGGVLGGAAGLALGGLPGAQAGAKLGGAIGGGY